MVKGEPWMGVVRPRGNHPDGSRTRTGRDFRKTDDGTAECLWKTFRRWGAWDAFNKYIENHSRENIILGKTLKSCSEKAKAVIV